MWLGIVPLALNRPHSRIASNNRYFGKINAILKRKPLPNRYDFSDRSEPAGNPRKTRVGRDFATNRLRCDCRENYAIGCKVADHHRIFAKEANGVD
jgi:hypothetical protein